MPYYIATREAVDTKAQWTIVSPAPIRTKQLAESERMSYLQAADNDTIKRHYWSVFNLSALRLLADNKQLANAIPKAAKSKLPNAQWLYAHTSKDEAYPHLHNVAVVDLPKRGRYAIAADGFLFVAQPTDLDVALYPGKSGKLNETAKPYPAVDLIIPSVTATTVHFDTYSLYRALKFNGVFAKMGADAVTITVKREQGDSAWADVATITAKESDAGDSQTVIACRIEGEPTEFTVDYTKLMSILTGWNAHKPNATFLETSISMASGKMMSAVRSSTVHRQMPPLLIEPGKPPIGTDGERLPFAVLMPMQAPVKQAQQAQTTEEKPTMTKPMHPCPNHPKMPQFLNSGVCIQCNRNKNPHEQAPTIAAKLPDTAIVMRNADQCTNNSDERAFSHCPAGSRVLG